MSEENDCTTCEHAATPSAKEPCISCFPPDWPFFVKAAKPVINWHAGLAIEDLPKGTSFVQVPYIETYHGGSLWKDFVAKAIDSGFSVKRCPDGTGMMISYTFKL
jgi:hypothetical protein